MELTDRYPIFIGFRLDGPMRRQLDGLTGSDRRYVSHEDSTFLRVVRFGEHEYVGKVLDERISTDRVDDVRRNVLSILQRLLPETRLPQHLDILVAVPGEEKAASGGGGW